MAPKKLLVADDSLTIQKVIRLALSGAAAGPSEGYDIQAVSDGNDAVQQISLFRPDVVLIDVSLPGKSAFEVKRSVNQHRDLRHVRFVLMSSAFEKVDEAQLQEVTFHGRLTKPFDPAHLREILGQVVSQGSSATDEEPTLSIQLPPASGEPLTPPMPGGPDIEAGLSTATLFSDDPPPPPELSGSIEIASEEAADNDIRNLTESTIRMSGLAKLGGEPPERPERDEIPAPPVEAGGDRNAYNEAGGDPNDFQWNVQESSLKPPASMLDTGDTSFPYAPPPEFPLEHSRFIERPLTAADIEFTPSPPRSDSDEFEFAPLPPPPPAPPSMIDPDSRPATDSSPLASAIDAAEMEKKIQEMIRSEVEKALRKLAQETLPGVAERLIKEEIHKLLTEAP